MRNPHDEYWGVSLPKDHDALKALDEYCQEWGGLSRPEATRRLLIEWSKLRQGQSVTAWTALSSPAASGAKKAPQHNPAAKAAFRALDE